jgi:hypothetical protein
MSENGLPLVYGLLVVAWLIIPIIVFEYCLLVVPRRYYEIRDYFARKPLPDNSLKDDVRSRSALWHYARLRYPDMKMVDPKTKKEREVNEEEVLDNQYRHFQGPHKYLMPLSLVMALSALMLGFIAIWTENQLNGGYLNRIDSTIVMALLGALTWSLYEILTRRKSGDLTPMELYDVALRFATAVPIGYGFSLLVFDRVSPWLAFAVSAFPLRDIRQLIRKKTLRKIGETATPVVAGNNQCLVGYLLWNIGEDTVVRLEELNICTCMDLAYTDPVKLMIKTGAPLKLVLAWIDKALVAVYAAPYINKLESLGMACALDLCYFYTQHCWDLESDKPRKDWENKQPVVTLAAKLQVPLELLVPQLLGSLFADPHTQFLIRCWYGPVSEKNKM